MLPFGCNSYWCCFVIIIALVFTIRTQYVGKFCFSFCVTCLGYHLNVRTYSTIFVVVDWEAGILQLLQPLIYIESAYQRYAHICA